MRSDTSTDTRVLLKLTRESIRRLDALYSSGKPIQTVFSYDAYGHRLRLKEALQKLTFLDPSTYSRRADELIWRKVFHEPLHLYKVYIKNNGQPNRVTDFELVLKTHLLSGIGYYQSFLLQLQSEFSAKIRTTLCAWLPIPFHVPVYTDNIFDFDQKCSSGKCFDEKNIQRCLIFLGDLFRYLIDFGEHCGKVAAYGYYNAALNIDSTIGFPHNQLGILDVGRCYGLNAIFHYLMCLASAVPFEGAKRNLLTVVTKNEVRYHRLFGNKPIFGLFSRHPGRYRPKEFRKTITKFIFVIQSLLHIQTNRSDETDSLISNVFQDTLLELHLMLILSTGSTLEPEFSGADVVSRTGCSGSSFLGNMYSLPIGRESPLFSERLTGPIFIRVLMIALLTADLQLSGIKRRVQVSQDKSEGASCRIATESSDAPVTEHSEPHTKPLSSPIMTEKPSSIFADSISPFGPLSFLLHLSELFMMHLCRQLDEHLVDVRFDKSIKTAVVRDQSTLSTRLEMNKRSNQEVADLLVDSAPTSSKKRSETVLCPLDSELGDGHSECRSDDTNEDEGDPQVTVRGSSGECSEVPTPDEDDDAVVDTDEDEDELIVSEEDDSSGELWSSDESSLLHSQDGMSSSDLSSAEDGEPYFDERLRRARLSHVRMRERTRATAKSTTTFQRSEPGTQERKTSQLDPITEEESICEPMAQHARVSGNPKRSRKADNLSNSSASSAKPESRYSGRCRPQETTNLPSSRVSADPVEVGPFPIANDPSHRARLASRLYLLASTKPILDWILSENFAVFRLLSECPNDVSHQHVTIGFIMQRWCSQLAALLNRLYPIFAELEKNLSDLSCMADGDCTNVEKQSLGLVIDLMSAHGALTLMRQVKPIGKNDSTSSDGTSLPVVCPVECQCSTVQQDVPLPEDWLLRGLPALSSVYETIDFHSTVLRSPYTLIDETILRVFFLISSGKHLASHSAEFNLNFTYDSTQTEPFRSLSPPEQRWPHSTYGSGRWSHPRRGRGRFGPRGGGHSYGRGDLPGPHVGRAHRFSRGHGQRENFASRIGFQDKHVQQSVKPLRNPSSSVHKRDHQDLVLQSNEFSKPSRYSNSTQKPRSRSESEEAIDVADYSKQSSNSSLLLRMPDEEGEDVSYPVHPNTSTDPEARRTQVMRDMARLRLISEVDQLARQCQKPRSTLAVLQQVRTDSSPLTHNAVADQAGDECVSNTANDASRNFVSPYAVLDAYCWASHLSGVKQLVNSRQFVIIVPVAVIAHLDYLKKTMATARVAIRYLEGETHLGNRYIRLQGPEEQPVEPTSMSRLVTARDIPPGEVEFNGEEPPGDSNRCANPRVVKRWLSILDCAVFFSELKGHENLSDTISRPLPERACDTSTSTDYGDAVLSIQSSACCNLLALNQLTRDSVGEIESETALVTILIGSRDTAIEDTIVPREFLNLVQKRGVRLDLFRNFMSRWRKQHPLPERD